MLSASSLLALALTVLCAYLVGSIPFGMFFARLAGAGDVRKLGSGNIGATNVLRTGKKWAAALTLVFDMAKGAVPVLVARDLGGENLASSAAIAAFLGHVFPVWLGFRGGKGVATFLGITLALFWPVGLIACATWLAAALLFRISSLSALLAAAATPFFLLFWPSGDVAQQELLQWAAVTSILAVLIFFTHRANILRLQAGSEPRIGAS
jgi:glycerol-3-phosphate acyltransferase PlsY